jgi:hypothetical protein
VAGAQFRGEKLVVPATVADDRICERVGPLVAEEFGFATIGEYLSVLGSEGERMKERLLPWPR